MENWKPVVGFEEVYEVSDLGRVRSLRSHAGPRLNPRILKASLARGTYPKVMLCHNRNVRQACVHTLVLEAFIGKRPENHQAAHLDGNPRNPALNNLSWVTREENAAHKILHGTCQRGANHYLTKLSDEQVRKIRELRATKNISYPKLGRMFGVSHTVIGYIIRRRTWRHI